MENSNEHLQKNAGTLLIIGAILLFVPYTILSIIFEYPTILRQETGVILTKFHQGGTVLILTWWTFAMVGLPLLGAYIFIGQLFEKRYALIRLATTVGIIGLVVQMIGLLRWTFVVPVLAKDFVNGDAATKSASIVAFKMIHQFGGVILGEHIGQIFTIGWTVMIAYSFGKVKLLPAWISLFGYAASIIYLGAQAELFATVIEGVPVLDLAGFLGSTLWLVWLILVGIHIKKMKILNS